MKIRKVIRRRIQGGADGTTVAGIVQAVVSANVGEPGTTATNVHTRTKIVQRDGRTEVFETESDSPEEGRR